MKPTEVIPNTWQYKTFKDALEVLKDGTHFSPKNFEGKHLYITSKNIRMGSLDLSNVCYISDEEHQRIYSSSPVKFGDVLLTKDGANTGNVCINPLKEKFSLLSSVAYLRGKKNVLTNEYLFQYLASPKIQFAIKNNMSGQAITRLTLEKIAAFRILLPPLPEQKAIADLLSTWDAAIEKTEQLIAAKEKLLDAKVQRIFGSKFVSQKDWKTVELGSLFEEVSEKVGLQKLNPYSISAGVGFVSQVEKWGKNISGSQYSNYIHLRPGEFAYNKGNSKRYPQGCAYLLREGNICVPNVFIAFRTRNANVIPDFYAHYFIAGYHSRDLKKYITSGARADGLLNLNTKDFFKIHVPFPKLEEQKRIASFLDMMRRELELLKSLVKEYKFQKRGLMQKLLTGQWRVKSEIIKNYGDTAL